MSSLHIQRYDPEADLENTKKPVLMLLHGGALSHRMYKNVVPTLTGYGYKVFVPDLPGHGHSKAEGPFTFQRASKSVQDALGDIKKLPGGNKVVLVGVSLGGQVVLDVLQKYPESVSSAVVSGVSIHPPNENAKWELPHMTDDESWKTIVADDVKQMGMENAADIQRESFSFRFQPPQWLPPVLVVVGEHDVAMAKRDQAELCQMLRATNERSRDLLMEGAWHNHPVDVPKSFAEVIDQWVKLAD